MKLSKSPKSQRELLYAPQDLAANIDLVAEADGVRFVSCSTDLELQARVNTLSPRQYEVLALSAEGKNGRSIASELELSPRSIRGDLKEIRTKLGGVSTEFATTLIPIKEDDVRSVCLTISWGRGIVSKLYPGEKSLWDLMAEGIVSREDQATILNSNISNVSTLRSSIMSKLGFTELGDRQAKIYKLMRIARGSLLLNQYADELAVVAAQVQNSAVEAIEDIDDEARENNRPPQIQIIDRRKNRALITCLAELGYVSDEDLKLGQISLEAAVALTLIKSPAYGQLIASPNSDRSEIAKTVIHYEVANYVKWLNRKRAAA